MKLLVFFIACITGTVMHFLYAPLGKPKFLALFLPVSESVWEHLKITFWPLCASFVALGLRDGRSFAAVACACLLVSIHSMACMFSLFYLYVDGFGVGRSKLVYDISIFYITMGSGFSIGCRLLSAQPPLAYGLAALALLLLLAVCFQRFSFRPPHLPLFVDNSSQWR